jgi:hypothetical protein
LLTPFSDLGTLCPPRGLLPSDPRGIPECVRDARAADRDPLLVITRFVLGTVVEAVSWVRFLADARSAQLGRDPQECLAGNLR